MNGAAPRLHVRVAGSDLTLGPDDFIAAGGEGRVFAKGPRAFKIFHDAAAAPPMAKLAELGALKVPGAILPRQPVFLAAPRGHGTRPSPSPSPSPIGYEMAWVDQAVSWGQSCTQAYKSRTGARPADTLAQIESLRQSLTHLHAQGCVVVDLSENNVVLAGSAAPSVHAVHLIDVDSWQTPTHLPTALTPCVASPFCGPQRDGRYGPEQDWFAFAVLSFTRLVGIHPFKGKHPRVRGLQARMAAGLSVLDPRVRVPAVCPRPHSCIPTDLLEWYGHVFSGQVSPAPDVRTAVAQASPARPVPPTGLRLWCNTRARIITVLVLGSCVHIGTTEGVEDANGARWVTSPRVLGLGVTDNHEPFALLGPPETPQVVVRGLSAVPLGAPLDGVTRARHTLFVRLRGRVAALDVRHLGKRAVPVLRDVARVLPRATRMFDGVLVQDLFGTARLTVLGHPSGAPSFDLHPGGAGAAHALRPKDIVDARSDGDRVVVCSRTPAGIREDVYVLTPSGQIDDHDTDHDADGHGTTFTETGGLVVHLSNDGLRVRAVSGPTGPDRPIALRHTGTLTTDGSNIAYVTARAVYRLDTSAVAGCGRGPSP